MQDRTVDRQTILRKANDDFRWEGVEVLPYKEDERALFSAVSKQVLFSGPDLDGELRYFEIAPGGFSSLERHEHVHAVLTLRGRGHCLVGRQIKRIEPYDLIVVPPLTWHQFRASFNEPLGFLCMVNAKRDRPQLPSQQQLDDLGSDPEIARFLLNQLSDS